MRRAVAELAHQPALRDENFHPRRLEPKQRIAELWESEKSRTDEPFAATQPRDLTEKAWQELVERVAKLKALRLAKEAADKEAAEEADAENKKPSRLPQAHRRLS